MLEASRLWVRPFHHNDADALHNMLSDEEVMKFYPNPPEFPRYFRLD
ncbi:GNAT family N-acetyltransferase [Peribacillus deserti]|nr:GNAT family N-acetyltransferase [Peribacillus deserti]